MVREDARGGSLAEGSSVISVRDQQRRLRRLAERLNRGDDLSEAERAWIAQAFVDIADGRDANEALAVKRTKGQKPDDEKARELTNFVMFWIAGAIENGIAKEEAFTKGASLLRKIHGLDPDSPDEEYSVETVKRYWSKYPGWQRPERSSGEKDSLL